MGGIFDDPSYVYGVRDAMEFFRYMITWMIPAWIWKVGTFMLVIGLIWFIVRQFKE